MAQELPFNNECVIETPTSPPGIMYNRPGANCARNSDVFNSFFKKQSSFVPNFGFTRPETVQKKIKVRFVVLEDNNTGATKRNFRSTDLPKLIQMKDWLNAMMRQMYSPAIVSNVICPTCHVIDERFEIELTDIAFEDIGSYPQYISQLEEDSILNVFFNVDENKRHPQDGYYYAAFTSFGGALLGPTTQRRNYIVMSNTYLATKNLLENFQGYTETGLLYGESLRLMHELHHTLGLGHLNADRLGTYGEDPGGCSGPDYLSDAFPNNDCWLDPLNDSLSNIMNMPSVPGPHWVNYITPLQAGRCHRSAFLGEISKYIYPVEAPDLNQWVINEDQTWDFSIRMHQDIVVKEGKVLTITCHVQMPTNARIIVEKGGKLIVDGGTITSYHENAMWEGIELEGNRFEPTTSNHQGTLILKNGASIERAKMGVKNYIPYLVNNKSSRFGAGGGGIIQAKESQFLNCARAVKLADYNRTNYLPGACEFDKVDFIWDDPTMKKDKAGMFTSWKTKGGVVIKNCNFINNQNREINGGRAILSEGSHILIKDNLFRRFYIGIANEGMGGVNNNLDIINNRFTSVTDGVIFSGADFGNIKGNTFDSLRIGLLSGVPGEEWDLDYHAFAIYLHNSSGSYVGCKNIVEGAHPQGNLYDRYGVIANQTPNYKTNVLDNVFNDLSVGIRTQKNNPSLNLYCNSHDNNLTAWDINPDATDPLVPNRYSFTLKDQGTDCNLTSGIRPHNVFTNNGIDINSHLFNTWTYWPWSSTGGLNPSAIGSVSVQYPCVDNTDSDPNKPCAYNLIVNNLNDYPFGNSLPCMYISDYTNTTISDMTMVYYTAMADQEVDYGADLDILRGLIIRGYQSLDDDAGLVSFLVNEDNDPARKMLIPIYLEQMDKIAMENTIDDLLMGADDIDAYHDYYGLLFDIQEDERTIFEATEDELATFVDIADRDVEVAHYAKSVLAWIDSKEWDHPVYEFTPVSGEKPGYDNLLSVQIDESRLEAPTPNPTNSKTVIQVIVSEKDALQNPELTINAIDGRQVYSSALKAGINHLEINTSTFHSGLYFYSLNLNNRKVVTKKLSIIN